MKKTALLCSLVLGVLAGSLTSCERIDEQDVLPPVGVVHDTIFVDYFPIVDTIETSDGQFHIYNTPDFETAYKEIHLLHLIHCTCSDGTINTLLRLSGFA